MYKQMQDTVLHMRVSIELKQLLEQTSKFEKRSMAKVAREAIEKYCVAKLDSQQHEEVTLA